MSALGQKQTYALQQAMSALHRIATTKANFRKGPCPLYPRKRTSERPDASLANAAQRIRMVTLMAGLEIAIHFATDSSLAQTLNYLGSDAPPIKLVPLL